MNSHSRAGFYAVWTLSILVCLALCILVLVCFSVMKGGSAPAAEQTPPADVTVSPDGQTGQDMTVPTDVTDVPVPTDTPEPIPTDVPQPASTVLAETADLGQEYQDKLVFLGDSTTYGLFAYNVLPHYQVWTPASGTLSLFNWEIETIDYYGRDGSNERLSIADCAARRQPEYLVITLGINGISILDESQFKDYYRRLVQAIQAASPNTRIMCQSIFPVIDSMTSSDISNSKVNAANGWIQSVAEELGVRYLNTHEALVDGSGNQLAEINAGDGIHVTPAGYERILQYVRTHGYQ